MNDECRTAIEDYYTLKNDYDQSYKTKRNVIIADKIKYNTLQKRRNAIAQIKNPCVHCKRLVGTIFSMENRTLEAKCGDVTNPCPLNIKIYKGRVTRLEDDFTAWQEDYIKEFTTTIVETKLDVLFQYISEEDAVKIFQETKEKLELYRMGYNTDYQLYLEKTTNDVNSDDLTKANNTLIKYKNAINELMQRFYKRKDKRIFQDIVRLYVVKIMPLLDTIRDLKYKYIQLEYDSDEENYNLKTRNYLIRDLETNTNEDDEPALLSNIK